MKMKDCRIVVRSFRKGDSKDRSVAMNARKTFRSEETPARKTVRIVGRIFRKTAMNAVIISRSEETPARTIVKTDGKIFKTVAMGVRKIVRGAKMPGRRDVAVKPRASGGN